MCYGMPDDVAFFLVTWRSFRRRLQFQSITLRSNCGSQTIALFLQYRFPVPPQKCTFPTIELIEFHRCNVEFEYRSYGFRRTLTTNSSVTRYSHKRPLLCIPQLHSFVLLSTVVAPSYRCHALNALSAYYKHAWL